MSSKRSAESDGGQNAPKIQKLSGRDHILKRPDMYCGSVSPQETQTFIVDDSGKLISKKISVSPAFLQIYEEAIMNAADRVSVSHECSSNSSNSVSVKTSKISIDVHGDTISVTNDGDGISCEFMEDHQLYTPELIFGHLLTSSNYNDEEKRLNVGRNGLGIKITNIFSKRLELETVDSNLSIKYRQIFSDNMSVIESPSMKTFNGLPYTKVSFRVDLGRFGIYENLIPEDIVGILRRRAYEICFCALDPIKVTFNGIAIKNLTIDKYAALYVPDKKNTVSHSEGRWKVAVSFTPEAGNFRNVSFVNSTCTPSGGTHLNHVMDPLLKNLVGFYRKKFKSPKMKTSVVKDSLTVFVSAHVENPSFSSQTKDCLTLPPKNFGSEFIIPDSMITKLKSTGLTDYVEDMIKSKESSVLKDNDGKKTNRIKGIPKLHDAQFAGTKKSSECSLIVTEGDSALTMALSATAVIGRDFYGCFPLRGKLLNVRDAPGIQVTNNAEISNIKKIMGLQNGVVYENTSKLRYGSIILLTDADLDGSHIRGLLLNLFETFWPSLLELGFVRTLNTPILRATKRFRNVSETKLFYNESEYLEWKNTPGADMYKIKYLKGLGSSTPEEARDYFKDVNNSIVRYIQDKDAGETMSLAFDKKRASDRKKWLMNFDPKEVNLSTVRNLDISDFVNKELIHFSRGDVARSIPSAIDGLKISQRKALCGSFLKGIINTESKVAQLTGFVSDKMQYHHGESSMSGTIVGLAQDFVGSNNINYLLPKGQLGSRLEGGKDAASPRYTFVQMNPLTSLIFRTEDNSILDTTHEDGQITEPVYYVPIIPTVLVNRCTGIGTGYSTTIPQFNPMDIIENVKRRINNEPTVALKPWYKGFTGTITESDGGFISKGVYEVDSSNLNTKVHITDLPVGTWTTPYKIFLESLLEKKSIVSYTEKCTDSSVDFVVELKGKDNVDKLEKELKLASVLRTSNMHMFDHNRKIKKYESISSIESDHFVKRLDAYHKRKAFVLSVMKYDYRVLSEKLRFFECKIKGEIVLENVNMEDVIIALGRLGFKPIEPHYGDAIKSFDYITSLKLFDLTLQKMEKLVSDSKLSLSRIESYEKLSIESMWMSDLEELQKKIS